MADDGDWGLMEITDEQLIEEARWNHEHHGVPSARCPKCNRFSRHPWEKIFGTQDGTVYVWGGVCKVHGPWSEST